MTKIKIVGDDVNLKTNDIQLAIGVLNNMLEEKEKKKVEKVAYTYKSNYSVPQEKKLIKHYKILGQEKRI